MTVPGNEPEPITRWYREPYAWLVFALPASVVVACAVTIVIAVRTSDALVVDDYYKQGLEINKRLVREEAAAELGLEFAIAFGENGAFQLDLDGVDTFVPPDTLDVLFAHATRAGEDRRTVVRHLGAGSYRGRVEPLPAGPWHVDVSTPAWRLVKRVRRPAS